MYKGQINKNMEILNELLVQTDKIIEEKEYGEGDIEPLCKMIDESIEDFSL